MKLKEVKQVLSNSFRSNAKTVFYLNGKPGCGKTSIVSQAANDAGLETRIINLTTCESVDLRGLPSIKNGSTTWASPLPKNGTGVLVLDEISSAPKDVQVAAHHIVWAEKNSDVSIPEGWRVVMTGNNSTDQALHYSMCAPLRNRVASISIDIDAADWCEWAQAKSIDPSIIGFIKWRPNMLSEDTIPTSGAFKSPRSWDIVSDFLKNTGTTFPEHIEHEVFTGLIGEAAAKEFSAYIKLCRQLPTINNILHDQDHAEIPNSPCVLYALVTALSYHTIKTGEIAMRYMSRCAADFAMMYLMSIAGHVQVSADKDCVLWIEKHEGVFK